MAVDLSALEKYLANEPLTPELADLRSGIENLNFPLAPGLAGQPAQAKVDEDRPLSKAERQALREASQAGGVTSLIRLLRTNLRSKIQRATIDSEIDPLNRQAEIAQTWAYIHQFRLACVEVEVLIRSEIAALEKEERGQ